MRRALALTWTIFGLLACGRGEPASAPTAADTTPESPNAIAPAAPVTPVASTGAAASEPPASEPAASEATVSSAVAARLGATPLPGDCTGSQADADLAAADAPGATLEQRIASVVPTAAEEKFLTVPWRTNLMAARDEAQRDGKPLFLWIMVGNPQGCT